MHLERPPEHAARGFRQELLSASSRSSPELRLGPHNSATLELRYGVNGCSYFADFAAVTFAFSSSRKAGE